ncbi:hypothetical protein [Phenylobacterium sp.]|uniref:hypothetical protein n=1 Tax=Phenylobacterium sp. TaxID=1871053 RepID=UPI00356817FD
MRRALALAALIASSTAGAAYAEHWTKFVDGANGTEWSYDGDYSYKDKQTGRLVIMQAISKPSASIAPGGPGTGVGNVYALDCAKHNVIVVTSYKPSAPFAIPDNWRGATPKKAGGAEDEALFAAVCPHIDHVPVK